jgi:hypothetical protein
MFLTHGTSSYRCHPDEPPHKWSANLAGCGQWASEHCKKGFKPISIGELVGWYALMVKSYNLSPLQFKLILIAI